MSDNGLSRDELSSLFLEIRPGVQAALRRRTGSPDAAADLTQDLFLRVEAIRRVLPDRDQAKAYIFRMAANIAIDRMRTDTRRTNILNGIGVLFEDASPSPETLAVDRDQLRRVGLALEELPEKCREVFMLARVEGLSHREIAERLNVSISLVEKYQRRALRHCRIRLEGALPE